MHQLGLSNVEEMIPTLTRPFCYHNYCSQSEREQSCPQTVNITFSMAVKSGSLMEELLTSSLCLQR